MLEFGDLFQAQAEAFAVDHYKRALDDMTTAERAMRADAEQDNVADVVGAPQTGTRRQS